MKRLGRALLVAGLVSVPAGTSVAQDKPQTETMPGDPSPAPPARTSVVVARPAARHKIPGVPTSGVLKGARALALSAGEARLLVDGAERMVHVGDSLEGAVVKSIVPGRMVLERPANADPKAGETLVIVEFDASGHSRSIVLSAKDPTAPAPLSHRQ